MHGGVPGTPLETQGTVAVVGPAGSGGTASTAGTPLVTQGTVAVVGPAGSGGTASTAGTAWASPAAPLADAVTAAQLWNCALGKKPHVPHLYCRGRFDRPAFFDSPGWPDIAGADEEDVLPTDAAAVVTAVVVWTRSSAFPPDVAVALPRPPPLLRPPSLNIDPSVSCTVGAGVHAGWGAEGAVAVGFPPLVTVTVGFPPLVTARLNMVPIVSCLSCGGATFGLFEGRSAAAVLPAGETSANDRNRVAVSPPGSGGATIQVLPAAPMVSCRSCFACRPASAERAVPKADVTLATKATSDQGVAGDVRARMISTWIPQKERPCPWLVTSRMNRTCKWKW